MVNWTLWTHPYCQLCYTHVNSHALRWWDTGLRPTHEYKVRFHGNCLVQSNVVLTCACLHDTEREREQWIINTHVLFVCLLSNKPQKETAGQGTCSLVKRAYALQGCIARYTAVGLNQLIKALIFGIINKSSLMSYWYAWCHKMLELRYWVHDLLVTHPYSWPLTSYPVSAVDHEALLCVR